MQQVEVALAAAPVVQGQRPGRFQGYFDAPVRERTPAHLDPFRLRPPHRTDHRKRRATQAGDGRRAKRNAHGVHFVLIGIVAQRVTAFQRLAAVQHLHRDGTPVQPREREGARARSRAGPAPTGRPHQHVASEERGIGDHHAAAGAGCRVPQHQGGVRGLRALADRVGIVAREIVEGGAGDLLGRALHGRKPYVHFRSDRVGDTAAHRVVQLAGEQRAPRGFQQRAAIHSTAAPGERGEWLGVALQIQLRSRVPAFLRRARAVHPLQGPRVPVRPAQLPGERHCFRGIRRRE